MTMSELGLYCQFANQFVGKHNLFLVTPGPEYENRSRSLKQEIWWINIIWERAGQKGPRPAIVCAIPGKLSRTSRHR